MSCWVPSASRLFVSCISAPENRTLPGACTVYWLKVVAYGGSHHPDGTVVPRKFVEKTTGSVGWNGNVLGAPAVEQLPRGVASALPLDVPSAIAVSSAEARHVASTTRAAVRR